MPALEIPGFQDVPARLRYNPSDARNSARKEVIMAKQRQSVQKRIREQKKREREQRKREKATLKAQRKEERQGKQEDDSESGPSSPE